MSLASGGGRARSPCVAGRPIDRSSKPHPLSTESAHREAQPTLKRQASCCGAEINQPRSAARIFFPLRLSSFMFSAKAALPQGWEGFGEARRRRETQTGPPPPRKRSTGEGCTFAHQATAPRSQWNQVSPLIRPSLLNG